MYHAPAELMAKSASMSPEDARKGMEGGMKWAAMCGDELVHPGTPIAMGQRLLPGGNSNASNMDVAGYSIMQAASMDEA